MKYLNRLFFLRLSNVVLLFAGTMDVIRGYTHTFRVRHAAANLAKIEMSSDSLVLMSAFGISNFLTGMIYILIVWKAKKLTPYVLVLIPLSYLIGGIGMRYSDVVMESEFKGQYMMTVYLSVCLITAILYFLASVLNKKSRELS
jgi:hypothetical protein